MKKILPILIISTLLIGSIPLALADTFGGPGDDYYYDEPGTYRHTMPYHEGMWANYTTNVTLVGGGPSDPAIIKAKWETPDDDIFRNHTQVTPIPGDNVTVTYHAVVRKGTGTIDSVWSEVYHPDGTYKYEVYMTNVTEQVAVSIWEDITGINVDCVQFNIAYFTALFGRPPTVQEMVDNILTELLQRDELYIGTGDLNYCQPAGWYTVGAIAHDNAYGWCDPLWNHYWYIPYAAFETDFNHIDWGVIQSHTTEWVDGDYFMTTPSAPTIRNIGNTPINFNISSTDMGFGYDTELDRWNVYFDCRLGHEVQAVQFEPLPVGSWPGDIGTDIPGGPIPLCTKEKIDFSIHIRKPTLDYAEGCLWLTSYIDPHPFTMDYWTPEPFRGIEPGFIEDEVIPSLTPDLPENIAEPMPLPGWTDFP